MRGRTWRGSRPLPGLLSLSCVVGAIAVYLFEAGDSRAHLDDAFISYRYARNLVEGYGLVYNPGEYVEGYTNLLWTLMVALGIWLGHEAPEVSRILSLLFGSGVLLATFELARGEGRATWSAVLAPWIVLSSAAFVVWSMSGMETPLVVLAVTAALAAELCGRNGLAATFVAIAVLTRPDGILAAAAIFGARLARGDLKTARDWIPPLGVGAVIAMLSCFRIVYYGSLLPNTFYAKVGGIPWTRGVQYTGEFLASGTFLLLYPAARAIWRDRRTWPSAAFVLITLAYVLAVGGDVFSNSRFLLPILPVLVALAACDIGRVEKPLSGDSVLAISCYLAAPIWLALGTLAGAIAIGIGIALSQWIPNEARTWRLASVGLVILAAALTAPWLTPREWKSWNPIEQSSRTRRTQVIHDAERHQVALSLRLRSLADDILRVDPPVQLVAAGGIGMVGYFSNLPIVDYMGLVTQQVARAPKQGDQEGRLMLPGHQSSNADYVLATRPDYIMISKEVVARFDFPAVRDILAHPDLHRDYEWRQHPLPGYWRREKDWKLAGVARVPGSSAWFMPGERPQNPPALDLGS